MRHDQHLGPKQRRLPGEQESLRSPLDVTADEHPPSRAARPHDDRRLVDLVRSPRERVGPRRVEHLETQVTDRHGTPCDRHLDGDASSGRETDHRVDRLARLPRHRPDPQRAHTQAVQDLIDAPHMVLMPVGHDHEVDPASPGAREP